jgi:hypothetical protein
VNRVQRGDAAFGESIAFHEGETDGFEELGEVTAEGRGSGGSQLEAAAQALANFLKHQTVGDFERAGHPAGNGFIFVAEVRGPEAEA